MISGDRTKSGKPLLANDPHLGLTTPSIWYLVHLHNTTSGKNVVGVGFPGTPSIILGRNDRVAWGFTNTAPDVQDLFIEKLVDDGKSYLTPTGPEPFTKRKEIIGVKGGDDIEITVLETRHGPVVSDVVGERSDFVQDGYVLAMQWTALQETDSVVTGLLNLAQVANFDDFKAAGRYYFGPEQNMIYADIDGNIGYYAPALVPVRRADNKIMGRLPSPGWDAKYDWQGYIPYEELPTRYNPRGGIIATANEKIVEDDYPHFITGDWSLPYRANRIRAQLAATDKHDTASFSALQGDITSDMARDLLPVIAYHLKGEGDVADALAAWDGSMDADRPEPLIFHELLRAYQALLTADELGDLAEDFTSLRNQLLHDTLFHEAVAKGGSFKTDYYSLPPMEAALALPWCDDVTTTDSSETCGDLLRKALGQAVTSLGARQGADWHSWRWGAEHILTQSHRPMSQVPFIKKFFEITTPVSGSRNTINVAGVSDSPNSLNQSSFGPSYRGIFDLSNLDASLYVQPTGQSGNPLSPHYDDLFPLWRDGKYLTIPTHREQAPNSQHLLRLNPVNGAKGTDSP